MREIALNTKTIRLLMEEPTVHLFTTAPCYLLMPLPNVGQVAVVPAIYAPKLMNKATALLMGKSVASAKVPIISKLSVILKAQPREQRMTSPFKKKQPQHQQQRRTSTGSNSGTGGRQPFSKKKKMPKKQSKQRAYGGDI